MVAVLFVAALAIYEFRPTSTERPASSTAPAESLLAAVAPAPSVAAPVAPAAPAAAAPTETALVNAIPIFRPPGKPSGTKVDPRQPAYQRVSNSPRPEGRSAIVDRAGIAEFAALSMGSAVSLPLMDGRVARGRVNLAQRDGAWMRVGGELQDGDGSFFLSSNGSKVSGMILLKREKLAYELEEQADGTLRMLEKARGDVVCDPIPLEEGASLTPREGPVEAVPILNSRPGATEVLYLDFDGETVTDPSWNNGNTIVAASFNFSAAVITSIFDRVMEDFYPFDVNVTTDVANYDNAPVGHRMRVIITPTNTAAPGAGGVAYLTSFRNGGRNFSSTIPCWVFNSGIVGVSEAVSHEIGHTMGLYHDGRITPSEGYYYGHGSGATSWAPIMGVGYNRSVVQWSKGEYTSADNTEDDLAIISASYNHFGYAADDAGNTRISPNGLSGNVANGAINQVGLIERTGDVDFYTFFTNGGQTTINAADPSVSPNLDIVLELQQANGSPIQTSNPPAALNATVSANLTAGQYFVRVTSTGAPTPPATGYTNYGSIGQYVLTGTVQGLTQFPLVTSAATASGQVGVSFSYRIKATGNPTSFGAVGTLPPGTFLDTASGYIVGYPTVAGDFPIAVTATNAAGTSAPFAVTITIADAALTLGEAVDFPSLDFTTAPLAPWVGQKAVSTSGGDSAQSAVIGDDAETSFSTSVMGPAELVFKWKVSSEEDGDFLSIEVDGVEQAAISGDVDWTAVNISLDANPHVVTWIYRKNTAVAELLDTGWVDEVKFNSPSAPVISSAATANGTVGTTFSYQIVASNIPWSYAVSGTLPLGLSLDTETGEIGGLPAAAGNAIVDVTATNNIGTSVPLSLTISIAPSPITVAQALDDVTAGAYATTAVPGSAAKWFPQTADAHDGEDAMRSGPIGTNEKTSITKTVSGINTANFWWKVEAKPSGNLVQFSVDGVVRATLSGVTGWENVSVPMADTGIHQLEWAFVRDASGSLGSDAAWLDQVVLTTDILPVISATNGDATGQEGSFFSYQIVASNNPTSFSATGLPDGLTVSATGLISGIPTQAGPFSVTLGATNRAGTGTKVVNFTFSPAPVTLAQAVEASAPPLLVWTTDSNFPWTPQTSFSFDGLHSGRSGALPQGGSSAIETHATGPVTVSFRWTVDSEPGKDYLRFYIDGEFKNQISGPMSPVGGPSNWEVRSYVLGPGDHTLRWVYSKDPSTSFGRDAAWLDAVTLQAGSSLPVISSPLKATAYVGRPFKYQMAASNSPTSFTAAPLPAGLVLDPAVVPPAIPTKGLISGTPTTAGITNVLLSGANAQGAGPAATLALTVAAEPAGANDFANATELGGAVISVEGTNAFATPEAGEPVHTGRAPRASLWYSWTAPLSGLVNVTTARSEVDTVLSVYENGALNSLKVIAENDDAGKLVSSAVKFPAVAGKTYLFCVDSLNVWLDPARGRDGKIVLNVIYAATGDYSGLLDDPNGVEAPGLANISLTSKFSFTGGIYFGPKKIGLKGAFTGEDFVGEVPRAKGLTPLQVRLHLDLSPGAEEITGSVVADGVTYNLFAKLAMNKADVPADLPGSFTCTIEPDDTVAAGLPRGTGYGSVVIDKNGKVKSTLVLGDGVKFTTTTYVAVDKSWVIYLNYKGGGGAAGEVLVDAGALFPPLSATIDWRRAADAKAKFLKNGFAPTTATLKGYPYVRPGKENLTGLPQTMFLTIDPVRLDFAFPLGDLVPLPAAFSATLDPKHKLIGGPAGLKSKFDAKSGLFSGSLLDSTGTERDFGGALLQVSPIRGGGLFFGTTTTGAVTVGPTPP